MTDPATGPTRGARPATSFPAVRAAGVAGLAFATLMTVSLILLRDPPPLDAAAFGSWWLTYEVRYSVGLYLIPFAGIAFLWVLAAIRTRIGSGEDQFFATVLLGSGLLFVAMCFASAAAAAAASILTDSEGEAAYETFVFGRALSRAFFFVFATKMAAAFMLVASTLGRRTGILPRWFALVGTAFGLVLLVIISAIELVALIFPLWVAAVSILLLRARREEWEGTG